MKIQKTPACVYCRRFSFVKKDTKIALISKAVHINDKERTQPPF